MTRDEMQLLLGDVEAAQQQLTNITARLRRALGGKGPGPAEYRSGTTKPRAQVPGANSEKDTPAAALLQKLACPRCKSPMVWRWSRANSEWFAGCSAFKEKSCRGSRSYDSVMGTQQVEVVNGERVDRPVSVTAPPGVHIPTEEESSRLEALSAATRVEDFNYEPEPDPDPFNHAHSWNNPADDHD